VNVGVGNGWTGKEAEGRRRLRGGSVVPGGPQRGCAGAVADSGRRAPDRDNGDAGRYQSSRLGGCGWNGLAATVRRYPRVAAHLYGRRSARSSGSILTNRHPRPGHDRASGGRRVASRHCAGRAQRRCNHACKLLRQGAHPEVPMQDRCKPCRAPVQTGSANASLARDTSRTRGNVKHQFFDRICGKLREYLSSRCRPLFFILI